MLSEKTATLDEAAFKKWLHASFELVSTDADRIAAHANAVVAAIDLADARTDEQVYIHLFSHSFFRASSVIKQAQIKRAAILVHHYMKSEAV